ncbi:MAG: T9SS type A sorting domain-containing protein [Ignavibacteria bacterium]|nr:T9SS type A sorting domain-containing protein [Ignavibacteria bacterium]
MKYLIIIIICTNVYAQTGWNLVGLPVNTNLNSMCFVGNDTGFIATTNGNILKTTNSGQNWIVINIGIEFNSISFVNSHTGFAVGGSLFKSTNGGVNWVQQQGDFFITQSVKFINEQIGYIISSLGQPTFPIYCHRTINGGLNWTYTSVSFGTPNFNPPSFPDTTNGFYANNNRFYKSSNSGSNWNSSLTGYNFNRMFNFINANTGFISSENPPNRYILKTTNSGNNWSVIYQNDQYYFTGGYFLNENIGYIVAPNGPILHTSNSGLNWETQYSTQPLNTIHRILFINQQTGFAYGTNGLLLRTTNGGIPLGVHTGSNEIPEKFQLFQNYPNPFNPNTLIVYDIPKSTFISLIVFDILGKELYTINEFKAPGRYNLNINVSELASGIYFYSLKADRFKDIKKMVLIK